MFHTAQNVMAWGEPKCLHYINLGVEVILMMLGWRTSKEREEVRDTVRRDLGAAKTKGT